MREMIKMIVVLTILCSFSGGLLAAVSRDYVSRLVTDMEEAGLAAWVIGVVTHWGDGRIKVVQDQRVDVES